MSTVRSSPETIRQMKSDINKTSKELRNAGERIRAAIHSSAEWNDEQGNQYRDLMGRIGRLIVSPVETLNAAQPKLEKLAQSLDEYRSVRF